MKKIFFYSFAFSIVLLVAYYFLPEEGLPKNLKITKLVVFKSKRELQVYSNNSLIKTYQISLGGNPVGAKQIFGDSKTPEGLYYIDGKNPNSAYHQNLGISYPSSKDTKNAALLGKTTGGDIKMHGLPNGFGFIGKFQRWHDWTDGCIGLTDTEIDELYDNVKVGTPIEIRP
jgi:murein L,D-transpeptidase YafK